MSEAKFGTAEVEKDLSSLASFAPTDTHDSFSQKNLRRVMMEAQQKHPRNIASILWEYDGEPEPALSALLKKSPLTGKIGIAFQHPAMDREAWEFTTPAGAIACDPKGAGRIVTFAFDPHSTTPWNTEDKGTLELCVVRFSLSEAFVPMSIRQEQQRIHGNPPPQPPFDLFSPLDLARFVRAHGVVPLRVKLLAYTTKLRYAYDIDLVHNALVKDIRAGGLPISERVLRSTRLYHGLDRFVARKELPPVPNTILEMLFETSGLNPVDISVLLHISKDLATASLDTLTARQKAVWNKAKRVYLPLPEAFLTEKEAKQEHLEERLRKEDARRAPTPDSGPPAPPPTGPDPTLPERSPEPVPKERGTAEGAPPPSSRVPIPKPVSPPDISDIRGSVGKLLEFLDEHPLCPLCGKPMSLDSRELICEACLREVGG